MSLFPVVDPIPLPAPVWLFKGLHVLMLALHFVAVELLLGGLLVATWLSLRRRGLGTDGATQLNAAASLARRLPVVMTYVMNLGVPPLLFAQVLYGRALYTSSVLIGVYWIAVVFLLIGCYWHLYRFSAALESGRAAWWIGASAWVMAGLIARIYSTNMTLMIRPEVWGGMYATTAHGTHLPPADPTLWRRWVFMLVGGLVVSGVWMMWLAGRRTIEPVVRRYLAVQGGRLALLAGLAQAVLAWQVLASQPAEVRRLLGESSLYPWVAYGWLAVTVGLLALSAWSGVKGPATALAGWLVAAAGFVGVLLMTVYRDGLRDMTLLAKGFNVWERSATPNWSVVGLFLVLFVAGLGVVAWLISVMLRAKPVSEKVV